MPDSPLPTGSPDPPDPERTELLSQNTPAGAAADATQFTLASDTPEPFPARVGRYHIHREIARGGMGVILAGTDPDLGRDVAVKLLLEAHQRKPAYRARFVEEARITSRLQHPGVIPVYELGALPDGRPYFVMRLVEGETFAAQLLARESPTDDLARFLGVFERICQTVAYAHAHGVIHRDLKPLNVMAAPFGVVKVMDWGVAKVLAEAGLPEDDPPDTPGPPDASGETKFGSVMGTPAYMAPEQAHGNIALLDRRTDVFGLGGILCAILTGQPPYPGTHTRQVYARASRADLGDAYARLDAAPAAPELIALAKTCLSADPARRPADAGEVIAALTAHFEADLRRPERDLVRFFELSPDLFCIAGVEGFFHRVNQNFTRILGYPPEELLSRPFIDFVHPDDRAGTVAETEKLAGGLPCVNFRNRYRDVAGNYRWFEWRAMPIPDEGVIFAVARDITDRVELEARLRAAPDAGG